jgi:hypothetical protein
MFFFSILYYYLGPLRGVTSIYYFICFPSVLFQRKYKLMDVLITIYLVAFLAVKFIQTGDITASILYLRLYWGFIGFYFFFRIKSLKYAEYFFMLSAYVTIVEFVLIRIYPGLTGLLPNYDGTFETMVEGYGFFGGVHSFGGNRSITGVLMLAVYVYFDINKDKFSEKNRYIVGIAALITFSASAWLIFIFYYLIRRANKLIFPIALILMSIGVIYLSNVWGRLSYGYIEAVYDVKADEINKNLGYLHENNLSYFFGTSHVESENDQIKGYGNLVGDFSYLDFYLRNGILGVIIFVLFAASNMNKKNLAILLVLIAGTFHYHVIFSFPGQIFFAYFLSLKNNENTLNKFQIANNTC